MRALLALALGASLVCDVARAQVATTTRVPPAAQPAASRRLRQLFDASYEASLRRNPILALARGDLRFADQFGDYVSDQYFAAERAAAEADLAALGEIDRDALSQDDRISYDVFKWRTELALRGYQPDLLAATVVRPINPSGWQAEMPDISSGKGVAPFKTVADYENNLKRLDGFILYLDRSIERLRQGLQTGVVQPRVVTEGIASQLDNLIARGVEGSPYYAPVLKFSEAVSPADRSRLRAVYAAFVRDRLLPAHARLRDFIRTEYLPKARAAVGISAMPGGAKLYRHLIEVSTTTGSMTPDEIHLLGLKEVARIRNEIEKVKERVGFNGTLAQFFEFMRANPRFRPASAAALREGYLAIQKKVNLRLRALFSQAPRASLDVRPVPADVEKTAGNAYYVAGPPDGSRPGVFYFNTHDLASRPTYRMEDLFLHEAIPGHHLQLNLAQENTALPSQLRFGDNPAFTEGWALYAETLGPELGLFTDAYQMYGHLESELWRAMRLVVDTGLHAKGWTEDEAVKYMLDNSARSRAYAANEVRWYVAEPGAALAYKIGQLKIRELRTKAERVLGPRFDPREFHAQVLMSGALPLAVLEAKIERWILSGKTK